MALTVVSHQLRDASKLSPWLNIRSNKTPDDLCPEQGAPGTEYALNIRLQDWSTERWFPQTVSTSQSQEPVNMLHYMAKGLKMWLSEGA